MSHLTTVLAEVVKYATGFWKVLKEVKTYPVEVSHKGVQVSA